MRYFVDADGSVRTFNSVREEADDNIRNVGNADSVKTSGKTKCKNIKITAVFNDFVTESNKKTIDEIYEAITKKGQFFSKKEINNKMLNVSDLISEASYSNEYICPECNSRIPLEKVFKHKEKHIKKRNYQNCQS